LYDGRGRTLAVVADDAAPHREALEALLEEARLSGESQSAQRRHHLVPAFYLRRWADEGKLRVTNVNARKSWITTPRRAATETDYYRIESPEIDPVEIPPLLFETALGKVEEWGADFIDAAIADRHAVLRDDEQRMLFSTYLAFQFVRGRNFREFYQAAMNDHFKLTYGGMTDAGIRRFLRDRGREPTEAAIAEMRAVLDQINSGAATVGPQKADVIGTSGQMVEEVAGRLFARQWRIYSLPPILVTSDEPVVPIPGPPHPRSERGGVADAGVVVFPLTPGLLLAAFDGVTAWAGSYDQLSRVDIIDLNREIAATASIYAFERPGRAVVNAFKLPPRPAAVAMSDPMPVGAPSEFIIRSHRPSRWSTETHPPPWPVERWFYE
jgi:hypothetical protein